MRLAWLLAWRNLTRTRAGLLFSMGGVALALTLTLALDAIFTGVANQLTVYVQRAGADLWVAQAGVRNMHMVASSLPAGIADQVAAVDGVQSVTPILYSTDSLAAGNERSIAYLIGVPPDASAGLPWQVVTGSGRPEPGSIVVDAAFAARARLGLGDTVRALGRTFRVTGLTAGTSTILNSVAFVTLDDFRAARGGASIISFILAQVRPSATPAAVASAIEQTVPAVTALTADAFAAEERRLVMDMSADVIAIMDTIGFVVALAIVGLTLYTTSLSQRRADAVLRAVGAHRGVLYRTMAAQAVLVAGGGSFAALALTLAAAWAASATGVSVRLEVTVEAMARTMIVATLVAAIASVLPVRQISRLDPLLVFRSGARP